MPTSKYPVKSKKAERIIIQQALGNDIRFLDMLKLSEQAFPSFRILYSELSEFWNETNTTPDIESFQTWCQTPEALDQLKGVIKSKQVTKKHNFYLNTLRHSMIGQGMLDMAAFLAENVGKTEPHPKLLQGAISKLTDLITLSSDQASTSRGFIWEGAPERWDNFKKREKDPKILAGIPFGFKDFDAATGGLHALDTEADLVTFFGKTGTYKSRTMMSMAYNQTSSYIPVMYITKEMAKQRIELLVDARESLNPPEDAKNKRKLDYQSLEKAKLVVHFRKRYKQLLETMYKRKYPFWLVDYPGPMTTIDIIRELEVYKQRFDEYPKVIFLDYANLIDPVGDWGGQESQKLDRIFLELLGITRGYRIPLVTAVRESRTGSLLKERDEVGIEHVGLSQAIGYHVHVMIHLDHTKDDKKAGILRARSKKNRYGPPFNSKLKVIPEYNYIGDWETKGDSFAGLD